MGCVALFLVVVLAMSHAQVHPALSIAANRIAQELSRQSQQAQGAAAASEVSAAS